MEILTRIQNWLKEFEEKYKYIGIYTPNLENIDPDDYDKTIKILEEDSEEDFSGLNSEYGV